MLKTYELLIIFDMMLSERRIVQLDGEWVGKIEYSNIFNSRIEIQRGVIKVVL